MTKATSKLPTAVVTAIIVVVGLSGASQAFFPQTHVAFSTRLFSVDPIVEAYQKTPKRGVSGGVPNAKPPAAVPQTDTPVGSTDSLESKLFGGGDSQPVLPSPPPSTPEQTVESVTAVASTPPVPSLPEKAIDAVAATTPDVAPSQAVERAPSIVEVAQGFIKDMKEKPIDVYFQRTDSGPPVTKETPYLTDYVSSAVKGQVQKSPAEQVADINKAASTLTDSLTGLKTTVSGKLLEGTTPLKTIDPSLANKKAITIGMADAAAQSLKATSVDGVATARMAAATAGTGVAVTKGLYAKLLIAWSMVVNGDWTGLGKEFPPGQSAPWIVAGFLILWGAGERESGREEIRLDYEQKLKAVEGKATVAEESATVAAESAKVAKEMVDVSKQAKAAASAELILGSSKITYLEAELEMLQRKVEQTREREAALLKQVKDAEGVAAAAKQEALNADTERIKTANTLEVLANDLALLKSKVGGSKGVTPKKPTKTTKAAAKKETTTPKKAKKEKQSVKAKKTKNVTTIPKAVKEETTGKATKKAKSAKTSKPVKGQTKASTPDSDTKTNSSLEAPVSDTDTVPEPKSASKAKVKGAAKKATPKRKVATKKASTTKAKGKAKGEGTGKGAKVETTANAEPEPVTTSKAAVVADKPNPWASMAASSLKRKTIKDLTAYLKERGITTVGEDGKVLKKDALVGLVQQLK